MKLLYRLVVDGDGHLSVSIKGELHVVAGPVLPCLLIAWQLQVLAAPNGVREGGRRQKGCDTGEGEGFQVPNGNMSLIQYPFASVTASEKRQRVKMKSAFIVLEASIIKQNFMLFLFWPVPKNSTVDTWWHNGATMRGYVCVRVDKGAYRTSRSVSLRMFIRLRNVFTGSWGGGAAYGNWKPK